MVKAYRDDMDAGRNPNKTIVYGYKSPDAVDWTPFLKGHQMGFQSKRDCLWPN